MAGILTRRQALAGGALGAVAALAGGAGLVQAGVLPGRYRVGRLLGACDVGGPPPTTVAPGPLRLASFPSQRRGRAVGYGIAWPPGAGPGDRLPVVVLLHAAAGNERTPSTGCALPRPRSRWPTAATTAPSGSGWPRPSSTSWPTPWPHPRWTGGSGGPPGWSPGGPGRDREHRRPVTDVTRPARPDVEP